jgi:hypothetical protein
VAAGLFEDGKMISSDYEVGILCCRKPPPAKPAPKPEPEQKTGPAAGADAKEKDKPAVKAPKDDVLENLLKQ